MKKIIFILFAFAVLTFSSCSSSRTIIDKEYKVVVEDVKSYATKKHNCRYVVSAWSYYPKIRKYTIYTDSLYQYGSVLTIRNNTIIRK